MKQRLLITNFQWPSAAQERGPAHTFLFTGLLQDQKLIQVHCERLGQPSILGNIYIGRVNRIQKNLNAAFIEFEPGRMGYYPLEDCKDPIYVKKNPSAAMVQGDEVLVQVQKENIKTKLPVLTTNINLTGVYTVLTSENKTVGVSGKIRGVERQRLTELAQHLQHNGADLSDTGETDQADCSHPSDTAFASTEAPSFGFILRTNAAQASNMVISEEFYRLQQEFTTLVQKARFRTCFSCLKQQQPDYIKTVQGVYLEQLEEIVTDLPDVYEELQTLAAEQEALAAVPIRLYEDKLLSLGALYNLEKQMERALGKQVWLPSGGYLVIEPTEALTVIDVNTGKSTAKKNPQEHFMKINKEAACEVAHQLRLRNLSGIILVDFIDLKGEAAQRELLSYLAQQVKADPVPVQVVDMTKLQLVELTRKKVSKSLKEQLT